VRIILEKKAILFKKGEGVGYEKNLLQPNVVLAPNQMGYRSINRSSPGGFTRTGRWWQANRPSAFVASSS
jgi:hypothetical protein